MKTLFLIAFALLALSGEAFASAATCLDKAGCSAGINVDSGNSSKTCEWYGNCDCESQTCHPWNLRTTCLSGWSDYGPTVLGKRCCHNLNQPCWLGDENRYVPTEEDLAISVEGNHNLEDSLAKTFDNARTSAFHGIVNMVSRSPNAGRSNALNARLDACLGYSNVDAFTDYRSCETACGDGSKNGYCQNSSNAVCIDRCECKYPGNGNCDGL